MLLRSLFGDDIFISYSRTDGSVYAAGLADELTKRKFSCFLDQLGTDPDRDLPASLKRKIRSCTVCILLGTERALISESVKKEIIEFRQTKRTIIPVYFEGVPETSLLYPLIPGLARSSEMKDALTSGNPSPSVVSRIEKSFNYTRRNERMRRILFVTAAIFLVLAVASVVAGIKASNEVAKAAVQTKIAEEARRTADDEKKKAAEAEAKRILAEGKAETARKEASDAAAEAKNQQRIAKGAEINRRDAEGKARKAVQQQELAESRTREAEKQRELAEIETRKQQKIAEDRQLEASSRELASNAISQLRIDPELSLLLATEAVKKWETAEAEDALRQSLLESRVHAVMQGHMAEVTSAEFSPDGEFVVMASADNTATVLKLSTGERIAKLQGHSGPINSATFSPNGQFILTASDDSTARVWEWKTNHPPKILSGHTKPVTSARFSPSGEYIVTTSADNTARIWSATTGQTLEPVLEGMGNVTTHGNTVQIQPVSPNGEFVIAAEKQNHSVSAGGWVWKLGTRTRHILQLPYGINIESAAFSMNGKLMVTLSRTRTTDGAVRDEEVYVWDLTVGRRFGKLSLAEGRVSTFALSPDGKLIVTASDNHTAQVWLIPAQKEEKSQEKNEEKSDEQVVEKYLVLSGHTGPVRSVAFSANGKFILSASDDKTARVWEASTGKEVAVLRGHKGPVESVAFSRDGKFMVTVGADKTTRVWDGSMGQSLVELQGHERDVTTGRFSLDDKVIVTTSDDDTVRIWNAITGASSPTVLQGHSSAISPDAKLAATAIEDNVARIYDTTGRVLAELRRNEAIGNVAFSPDGKLLMTTGREVRLWDAATGELIKELPEQTEAAFSLDSKTLITLSDGMVRRWDTNTWQSQGEPWKANGARNVTFSGNGLFVLTSGSGRAQVWEASTGCSMASLPSGARIYNDHKEVKHAAISHDGRFVITSNEYMDWLWDVPATKCAENKAEASGRKLGRESAAFSPDGMSIVTTNGQQAEVLDVTTLRSLSVLKVPAGNRYAAFSAIYSPDGKLILTTDKDKTARVWDVSARRIVCELTGLPGFVTSARFSADGRFILTGSRDLSERENILWLWETSTGKRVAELHGHGAALSPDGKLVAALSDYDMEQIWDTTSGQSLATLRGHTGRVTDSRFSPDGRLIATVTDDGALWVWEVASGRKLVELRGHTGKITSAAFSPDNRLVLTTAWYPDGVARVWDVGTGQSIKLIEESDDCIRKAALSPNGGYVVTASNEGIVRVWTLPTENGEGVLEKSVELHGLTGEATSVSFSHDGKLVIATSWDGTTRVWEASSGKLLTDLLGHEGGVWDATFSPDDKFILTRSYDNTARVWEASTGREMAVMRGHESNVLSATFSTSGKFIVITNAYPERTASVYACVVCGRVEDLLAVADNRLLLTGREFTPQEQRTYLHKLLDK